MHYSASVGAVASFSAADRLPATGVLWTISRALLQGAGALFVLYLMLAAAAAVMGKVWRARDRRMRPQQGATEPAESDRDPLPL